MRSLSWKNFNLGKCGRHLMVAAEAVAAIVILVVDFASSYDSSRYLEHTYCGAIVYL